MSGMYSVCSVDERGQDSLFESGGTEGGDYGQENARGGVGKDGQDGYMALDLTVY